MRKLLLSIAVIFSLIECLSAQNIYENSEYGFKINFPDDWIIKKSVAPFTIIKAVKPPSKSISYIAIAAYPISQDDIEYYKNASPRDMFDIFKEEYPGYKLVLGGTGITEIQGIRTVITIVRIYLNESDVIITGNRHLVHNQTLFRFTFATDGGESLFSELNAITEKSIYSVDFD